jgi:hypothetical protein
MVDVVSARLHSLLLGFLMLSSSRLGHCLHLGLGGWLRAIFELSPAFLL